MINNPFVVIMRTAEDTIIDAHAIDLNETEMCERTTKL